MLTMQSQSMLNGDRKIPGFDIPKDLDSQIPVILKACRDFGLDFYDVIVEILDYDQMAEIASYGGFPRRYPHWRFGMEYEEMSKGFEHGQYRIYEMVVNTDPCRIYNLASNTLVDHVTVVAHATAHNDFFKNNRLFKPTNTKMLDELANHGTRVRRYMAEWGGEPVQRFLDRIFSLETLIDPAKAYVSRKFKEPVIWEKRKRYEPRQVQIHKDQEFLQDWINTKEWFDLENKRIKDQELAQQIGIMVKPERDVFGFLKENAPLRPWQQDVISMIYEETMYFAPQRATKTINEGWASFVDSQIMARFGMAGDGGIYEYAKHKAGVLGGRYSTNPYKMGYSFFSEIEDRWNKGRFGHEYDMCDDFQKRETWDKKIGLGLEKCFDVRAMYDDMQLISEFFDRDFCNKYEFFEWIQLPDGSREIKSRDYEKIKKIMLRSKINSGFPDVRVVESNFRDRRILALQHFWDGRILDNLNSSEALESIASIWDGPTMLLSKNKAGKEFCYYVSESGAKPIITTVDKI